LLDAAEQTSRLAMRVFGREPTTAIVLFRFRQMRGDFLLEIAIRMASPEQTAQTRERDTKPCAHWSSGIAAVNVSASWYAFRGLLVAQ
jgi:hypothetical protein